MTSQVALLNMDGVAIASDTVVTLGAKTIPGVSKIIELGPKHKVAVMWSGSALMNGVSVRQLIAEWASTLLDPLASLADYTQSFIGWVRSEDSSTNSLFQLQQELDLIAQIAEEEVVQPIAKASSNWFSLDASNRPEIYIDVPADVPGEPAQYIVNKKAVAQLRKFHHEIIENEIAFMETFPLFTNWTDEMATWYLTKGTAEDQTREFLDNYQFPIHGHIVPTTTKTKELLTRLLALNLSRRFSRQYDTIVAFTGFGTSDRFPKTAHLRCRGVMHGALRFMGSGKWQLPPQSREEFDFLPTDISLEHPALLETFAQDSAIQGFFHGISPQAMQRMRRVTADAFREFLDNNSTFNSDEMEFEWSKLWQSIEPNLKPEEYSRMTPEFEQSVAAMSLQNMKQVAESLVSIQALASFGAAGPMTVGGRIETMTIDRVYGIRWWDRLDIPQ